MHTGGYEDINKPNERNGENDKLVLGIFPEGLDEAAA
jgi:hypothetical protein